MSVVIILGKNGSGKDMAAVQFGVVPSWRAGRAVWANCSLYPEEVGFDPKLYNPLNEPLVELPRLGRHTKMLCCDCRGRAHPDRFRDGRPCFTCGGKLVEVPRMHPDGGLWSITENVGVGILLSDITAAFPSRETLGLPPELAQTMQQLRKPDLAPVMITCPAFARVDLLLRECAALVIESHPFNPLGHLDMFQWFREPAKVPLGWPRNKAFQRYFYDALAYEQADATGRWDLCPPLPQGLLRMSSRIIVNRRKIRTAQRAYDTNEDIELSDHVACGECGGRLPRKTCKEPEQHRAHARSMRKQREVEAYPIAITPQQSALRRVQEQMAAASGIRLDELRELATPDRWDEDEAEQLERVGIESIEARWARQHRRTAAVAAEVTPA